MPYSEDLDKHLLMFACSLWSRNLRRTPRRRGKIFNPGLREWRNQGQIGNNEAIVVVGVTNMDSWSRRLGLRAWEVFGEITMLMS